MASLKDVRTKIGGVKKTRQITNAMNMVSSAKLRGAQQHIEKFRPYADKFYSVLEDLAGKIDPSAHPLLVKHAESKTVGIILVTSDRGLCGSFNVNLINKALGIAKAAMAEGKEVKFYCIGKKGRDAIRRLGYTIAYEDIGHMSAIDFIMANDASNVILRDYLDEAVDTVHLIHGKFINVARQDATVVPLLPIDDQTMAQQEDHGSAEFEYEPSVESLLEVMLPRFVRVQIYRGILDTSASEHAARMTAMDNATRNCDEIESQLTLLFNKTRQAAITTDLIDIVSGAGALNG